MCFHSKATSDICKILHPFPGKVKDSETQFFLLIVICCRFSARCGAGLEVSHGCYFKIELKGTECCSRVMWISVDDVRRDIGYVAVEVVYDGTDGFLDVFTAIFCRPTYSHRWFYFLLCERREVSLEKK